MWLLRGIDTSVEAREPQRTTDCERERGNPSEARCILKRPEKQDQRRRSSESDIVAERVQLGTELALGPQQSGDAAVETVQHARKDDRAESPLPLAPDGQANAREAKAQRHRRDRIGDHRAKWDSARTAIVRHWLTPVSGTSTPISANTVSPAIERWPRITRGAVPAGR